MRGHAPFSRHGLAIGIALVVAAQHGSAIQARTRGGPAPWWGPHVHRVAPDLEAWFSTPAFRAARGRSLPGGLRAALGMEVVSVTIRLRDEDALRSLVRLEGPHLELRRHHGRLARVGDVVCARVDARGVALLRDAPWVARVELDMRSPAPLPLDLTGPEIQADAVWQTVTSHGLPVDGAGVIIADIDSPPDVHHPMFFRADGGYFDWIDVNGNDRFEPGVDAVDLDGDGVAGPGETLEFFDAVIYSRQTWTAILDTDNGEFDVGWDHLYADTNGNGVRDFGPEAGYGDADPSFGEPLLLVDDVNGNGRLDPGEKLVGLGTSKIRALYDGEHEFLRGVNLSAVQPSNQMHANCVLGILMGGNRGLTRLVGIAPGAEVMAVDYHTNWDGEYAALFSWAVDAGAQVVLHEYAPYYGYHLDGSSNYEAMLDQAAADGVVQVNPAGNLGSSHKTSLTAVPSQGATEVVVRVPEPAEPEGEEHQWFGITLLWRAPARDLSFRLEAPSGEVFDLGELSDNVWGTMSDPYVNYFAGRDDSSRGTAKVDLQVWGADASDPLPIPVGDYRITVTDVSSATPLQPDIELVGYVMDDLTSWGGGVGFARNVSHRHVLCYPSTADSAITVAAYAGHTGPIYTQHPEEAGELRGYSGRGKRIDGVSVLDVAAPADPVSALNRIDDTAEGGPIGLGALTVFGGTSGAGPHVAGAAAMLKQLHPDWTGLEVRDAIRAGAEVDAQVVADATHAVEDLWGAGKLRAYQTLYGQSPAPNTAPTLAIAPRLATLGQLTMIRPDAADAEDPAEDLQVLWDDDYDGEWDFGPLPSDTPRGITFDAVGTHTLKVMVIDTGGYTAEALARITVVDEPTCDGTFCEPPDDGDQGCGCASGASGEPAPCAFFALVLLGWLWRRRRA